MLENINLNISTNTLTSDKVYLNTPEQSLNNMIETPKGSRTMRPLYGSEFYKLVDVVMNDIWVLKAKKMILECTKNTLTQELWDERVEIKGLTITIVDSKADIEVELC
ncbi:hypothetical protein [Sulfurimonas sp.]|uniref:hypothetical protein n=1 Tax=Sulfurimonas sp. TaxID=2022749 RepID=UPI002B45D6BA|nr:hypothetical protein [Sulfurimonas sp.]